MQEYNSVSDIQTTLAGSVDINHDGVIVHNAKALREKLLEEWLFNSLFHSNPEIVEVCRYLIRQSAQALGIFPSSIQSVYTAMGQGKLKGFTTPAINIRGLTYDVARTILKAAKKKDAFPVIFEIARSEVGYTFQQPAEYATNIIAAAIKEEYEGPLYIQGDHFQVNAKKYATESEKEIVAIRKLIDEALEYGFFNIDIDTSTLVDLGQPTLEEQQRVNFELCAAFTQYIRQHEPKGVTVSVGGEIGEVGQKNSTVEELEAYMDGYLSTLKKLGSSIQGISKISVQTGTSHGGIPMPDGSVAKVKLDFETLRSLSEVSLKKYALSGAVQHGASTLPDELFDKFPQVAASEIHLATGFQNMIYDHPKFPRELKDSIYAWLKQNCASERKASETDEQFYYKTRKKGFGPFKKQFWNLSQDIKNAIMGELQAKFEFLFDKLAVSGKRTEVIKFAERAQVNLDYPSVLTVGQKKIANGL